MRRNTFDREQNLRDFMNRIKVVGECWMWQGAPGNHGYGQFEIEGEQLLAHRASWKLFKGELPRGRKHHICHSCDVPLCVFPGHLFLGNAKINGQDASKKGLLTRLPDEIARMRAAHWTKGNRREEICAKIKKTWSEKRQ